jgi:hypothetical protein
MHEEGKTITFRTLVRQLFEEDESTTNFDLNRTSAIVSLIVLPLGFMVSSYFLVFGKAPSSVRKK